MYSFNFGGKKIELPKYSVELAQELEQIESVEYDEIYDHLKAMYDFLEKIMDVEELIGAFGDADPNDINILFISTVNTYNKPTEDYNLEQSMKVFDNPKFKQSLDTIGKVVEANKKND